jgi:CMP-N-acetylneuraminic acid synthetase
VLKHVLTRTPADVVVILQATSPIRNAGLIDDCVRTFLKADADNLATGFVCKFKAYGSRPQRRQDVKGFFYDDGNIYVVRADLIRRSRRFGKKIIRYETSREENFEIDDEFDFWMAEKILLKRSSRG